MFVSHALLLLICSLTQLCVSSTQWPYGIQYKTMTRQILTEYGCHLCGENFYGAYHGGFSKLCTCSGNVFFVGASDSTHSPNTFLVGAFLTSGNYGVCHGTVKRALINGAYWSAGQYRYPADLSDMLEFKVHDDDDWPVLQWLPWQRSSVSPYTSYPPGQGSPIVYGVLVDNEVLIQSVYSCPSEIPVPTRAPTALPSPIPTPRPSPVLTPLPTRSPTTERTPRPTRSPTTKRTPRPTRSPTTERTPRPTRSPTTPRPSRNRAPLTR